MVRINEIIINSKQEFWETLVSDDAIFIMSTYRELKELSNNFRASPHSVIPYDKLAQLTSELSALYSGLKSHNTPQALSVLLTLLNWLDPAD